MFLPLDRRINEHRPWATFGLAAVNTLCFFAMAWSAGGVKDFQDLWSRYGYTPAAPSFPAAATHLFIHAGWEHLVGNMLFLVFLGMNCERRLGPAAYLGIYFLSGFGALALFAAFNPGATVPLGGASGAISGVAGIYLALFARKEVEVFWFAVVAAGTLRTPAWVFTLLWAGCEVAQAVLLNGTRHNVANLAHVGGFLAGVGGTAMLIKVFRFRGRPERAAPRAEAPRRRDTFEELAYIPLRPGEEPQGRPETAVIRDPLLRTYALVARRFGPLPEAAAEVLPASGPARPACLARGLDFQAAEGLQLRLGDAGCPSFIITERSLVNVPPLVPLAALAFEGSRLLLGDDIGGSHAHDLSSLYMISAGRVRTPGGGERTFVDLFTTNPWSDFRFLQGDPVPLARELLARAGRVPAARSFVTLAREGRVTEDAFPDLPAYDDFNLWMLQVYASGIYRKPME
jgi:membrane associated rhomboid family serine protease